MSQSSKKSTSAGASPVEQHADPLNMDAGEEEPDVEELERLDGEAEAQVVSLSSADVERLRGLSLAQIKEMDSYIESAVEAFFANRIADCEAALRARMNDDPLAVCGAGLIAFVRCALSMEQAQADVALELLTRSSALATQVMPSEKNIISRGLAKVFQRKKDPKDHWLNAAEFRAKTTHAESQALRCFTLVLQQSVPSVLKAGLALNRGNGCYKALYAELSQRQAEQHGGGESSGKKHHRRHAEPDAEADGGGNGGSELSPGSADSERGHGVSSAESAALENLGVDRNSVHCVEFGLGAINVALSILPSNVRTLLRFIGVDGDREEGLKLVWRCFKSDSLLSPFASALLLTLYGMLPSSSAFLVNSYLPCAEEVRREALKKESMRESILHLWLDGHIERLTRNVELSITKLNRCLEVASNPQLLAAMPQLRDFAVYDQWFNYAIVHQWKRASRCLEILSKTSKWANAVYQYIQACCLEMLEIESADGVENPDGDLDFPLEDLHRILGASEDGERQLTFCDLSTREATAATITRLYWEAAQRKPVTLGGKPNHNDQFVLKRMEEILVQHGIAPSSVLGKKKLGEPLEPVPDGLELRNIVPLPAYEKLLIVGISHQCPADRKDWMVARIDAHLLVEPAQRGTALAVYVNAMQGRNSYGEVSHSPTASPHRRTAASSALWNRASPSTPPLPPPAAAATQQQQQQEEKQSATFQPSAPLPANYGFLCLCVCKAMLLANSESKADRQAALEVIEAIGNTPQYKDRQWSLSYAQPFALYERAYIAYQDEGPEDAEVIMNQLQKQYGTAHYFMHAKIDLKAHLAAYQLHEERKPRVARRKPKK
ncbi:hypothetical protein NESM_000136700 [Novymonas esmeraldas]|uniref:Uncharacterized protein n=1 Tax=Novymonas esmeraldas TaxID=1808958 RepID=A0AAW0F3N2_9TRYP